MRKKLRNQLLDPNISYKERERIIKLLRLKNFAGEISLLCYCLMPNHFHLLLKQQFRDGIDRFMRSVGTRYAMYFNKKYRRIGHLYQDVYKAVLVDTAEQLLQLSSYIHRNPLPKSSLAIKGESLRGYLDYQPSSYPDYIGSRKCEWINSGIILPYFSKINPKPSYQAFVERVEDYAFIQKLTIDD